MEDPCCGNCRYWLQTGNEAVCRRFPPNATFIPASGTGATVTMPQTLSYFPGMQVNGWCGEHAIKTAGRVLNLIPGDGSLVK